MNNRKWGLGDDEDACAKATEDMYCKELKITKEEVKKQMEKV